ncbi:MAG TPA: DUF6025 family protein, partial [Herpetosiphonaceae bacterium]|nr:DUF6025 family protein [Herpetosiphonaceae bacterium]
MSRMIPSGQTAATPLGLLKRLGALETHESQLMIEAFSTRQLGFDWMHLGMTDLAIGTLLDVIRSVPALAPPRSGHLGNWDEILNGRAGMMDFNLAICGQNLGYPLIYCFNQTEDATLQQGDWVYLPGSLVSHGRRQELPLFTWDGTCFRRRDRSQPLFTPLVNVEFDGHLVPLVTVHWARMQQGSSLPFRLEATVFHRHAGLLKQILLVLLEDASHQANPRRAFQDLFSHQVSLDGRMSRAEVQREGAGYRVGEAVYSSADELVGAALLPFMAVAEPDQFMQIIGGLPGRFPLISNTLSGVLSALLSTHYPDGLI